MRLTLLLLLSLLATPALAAPPRDIVLSGGRVVGTGSAFFEGDVVDVRIHDGRILAVAREVDRAGATLVDMHGKWLAPAFIDSHVHIVYQDFSAELPKGGIAAVVDLAAPIDRFFGHDFGKLQVIGAGPMITAVNGYPTTSWGSDGYGLIVTSAAEGVAAVERLAALGARVIKIPFGAGPDLPDDIVTAVVAAAHAHHLPVAAHATSDAAAARAARLGADVLAHAPTNTMSDTTVAAWSTKVVIPTLTAFGGSAITVDNLRKLHAAGATIFYGTDLGNTSTPSIGAREVALMVSAGMDGGAILRAGTAAPAAFWGFTTLGRIAPGKAASLLVLDADPRADPSTLSRPTSVWIDGAKL